MVYFGIEAIETADQNKFCKVTYFINTKKIGPRRDAKIHIALYENIWRSGKKRKQIWTITSLSLMTISTFLKS